MTTTDPQPPIKRGDEPQPPTLSGPQLPQRHGPHPHERNDEHRLTGTQRLIALIFVILAIVAVVIVTWSAAWVSTTAMALTGLLIWADGGNPLK